MKLAVEDMSLYSRIKDVYVSLTTSEKIIADYFLAHEEEVEKSTVKDLAKKCGVSAATIVRFSRSLGYSGLPALKMDLIVSGGKIVNDLTEELSQSESVRNIAAATYSHRMNTLEKTYELIDEEILEEFIQLILDASAVYLCGIGGSGLVCQDIYQKFTRIGIRTFYSLDEHVNITSLAGLNKGDILLAVSYSGETNSILKSVEIAKEKGAYVACISRLGKTSISKNSDYIFSIPVHENTVRAGAIASRDSSLLISDVIYLSLFSKKLKENKKNLEETKKWTEKL